MTTVNVTFKSKPKIPDFSRSDIVRSTSNGLIVMVAKHSSSSNNTFAGVVLKEPAINKQPTEKLGSYTDDWIKSNFEPFEGSITLDSTFE